MDFVVEDLSPVRKKITVTATAAEVDQALDAALRHFRKDLAMPGFRKGKVPSSVVEKRFGDDMKARVVEEWLGDKLDAFITEKDIVILSRPDYEGGGIERGKGFSCTVSFDVMPEFTMPDYVGLPVEQEEVVVPADEIDDTIKRLLSNMAEESPVDEARGPVDGESVDVDFAGFEDGAAIADVKGEHFRVVLGEGQVLPDFESLVKALKPGEEQEGPVTFPENYAHQGLAGKTISMRVKLHGISTRTLPELNEDFAKKMGLDSVDKLRDAVADSLKGHRAEAAKSMAQQKLMDDLLSRVDFPLPETMVNVREQRILGDARIRLEQQDATAQDRSEEETEAAKKALEETLETMKPQARKDAELFTRMHLLLMTVARRENITVTQQEADMQLYSMAMRSGQDFSQLREAYVRSGLMGELMERIQADKAMNFIYDKANVTMVASDAATKNAKAETPADSPE